jgi:hypothetical protein
MKKPTGPVIYTVTKGAGSGQLEVVMIIAVLLLLFWLFA